MSSINLDLLCHSEDNYLLSKVNRLVTKQEQERIKEKEKNKSQKKPNIHINTANNLSIPTTFSQIDSAKTRINATEASPKPIELSRINSKETFNFIEISGEKTDKDSSQIKNESKNPVSTSKHPKKNAKSLDRINEIVTKTQSRYKLKTTTKEHKFDRNLKDFKKLDTFLSVKSLLHSLNFTNTPLLKQIPQEKLSMLNQFIKDKDINDSVLVEEEDDVSEENDIIGSKLNFNLKSARLRELNRTTKKDAFISEEELKNKLKISGLICDYLQHDLNKRIDSDFEKKLVEEFEKNDLKLHQQKNNRAEKYSISQEMELKHLENFVQHKVNENVFKKQLQNGDYFDKYRTQASKVLQILRKTTKNIYSSKVAKINENLMKANKKLGGLAEKTQTENQNSLKLSLDLSKMQKENKAMTFHKNSLFLTDDNGNSYEKSIKTTRNQRVSTFAGEITLPSINRNRQKLEIPLIKSFRKKVLEKNKLEGTLMKEKMEEFLKKLEDIKQKNYFDKEKNLKEIDLVQSTIDGGLEKLKGPPELVESLRITLDKSKIFGTNKKKKRGSYLSVGSIVGLI